MKQPKLQFETIIIPTSKVGLRKVICIPKNRYSEEYLMFSMQLSSKAKRIIVYHNGQPWNAISHKFNDSNIYGGFNHV